MSTFENIAERIGADPDPGLTTSWSGACPCCGGRRMLSMTPHEGGTASVWCLSGRCNPQDVVAGLRLREDEVLPADLPYMFAVRHAQPIAETAGAATSWSPQDILSALSGDYEPETTKVLRRSDGVALFYPGRVHWLMGESESGKSWVALLAAAEVLVAGERALFVDFESDLQTVGRRLLALGVPLGMLAEGLTYVRPGEKPEKGTDAGRAFDDVLSDRYAFATVDGITDALMVYGLDPNVGDQVATFIRSVPRRIAEETGAAVACVDHVTKNAEGRGRFAIGSQHKIAGLDGAAYMVEPVEPLAPGAKGLVVLRVAKDRPGWVRAHAGRWTKRDRTQEAARVVLDSTEDGVTRFEVLTPETIDEATGERSEWRPTAVMHKIVEFLRAYGDASQRTVEQSVPGRSATIREAVGFLVTDGVVTVTNGPRGSKVLSVTNDDPGSATASQNRDAVTASLILGRSRDDAKPQVTPSGSSLTASGTRWDAVGRGQITTASRVPVSIDGTRDAVSDAPALPGVDEKESPHGLSLADLDLPPADPAHLARLRDRRA